MSKNNKKNEMDVVLLLDRSGSMSGIEEDTIGGYNSYIEKQRNNNVKVTTVLFDNMYEMINNRKSIKDVEKLDNKTYYVRGCTALMDAIGKTIKFMEQQNPKKVIFIITTDGLENASKEYNKKQIKEMIMGHKNWEFMYIGADIDSYNEGMDIGIRQSNISNYKKNKAGVSKLFNALGKASCTLYESDEIAFDWKNDLEEYIKQNADN